MKSIITMKIEHPGVTFKERTATYLPSESCFKQSFTSKIFYKGEQEAILIYFLVATGH